VRRMRPVRRFEVRPTIPDTLAPLPELAANLHWAWDRELVRLFERIWPGWTADEAHPAHMVRTTSSERLAALAEDQAVVRDIAAAKARLDAAINGPTWFATRSSSGDSDRANADRAHSDKAHSDNAHSDRANADKANSDRADSDKATKSSSPLGTVAYFSPEFGLTEALPQYSGGLGVLSGDHLKASSDLGIPLVAIGLLYTEGYFHQVLDANGWQQERALNMDPQSLGLTDTGVRVTVDLAGDPVAVRVWRCDVGRVPLFFLDTEVEGNSPDGIAVTDRLYGGDSHHRLRQEIILGIGGVRALRALGIHPEVFHSNEGHAGFLNLERIREHVLAGLPFAAAMEAVRAGCVFTTHTPVPAGIDRFEPELIDKYFGAFAAECGVTVDELLAVGRSPDEEGEEAPRFNMAVMGMRLSARRNGVARLHGKVSRTMFNGLWPGLAPDETPIGAITNGVHGRSWTSSRVDALLTRAIGDDWWMAGPDRWQVVYDFDPAEIWDTMVAGRRGLVRFVRGMLGGGVLNPDTLTIGFARRFATYKRATLLLSQPERLIALINDADRPVQFLFAGKAHPADHPGKELIQQIQQFARKAGVRHRFVFLSDYDIAIAREMYHGCDVWLNTPRRPLEACGTSGMKAALNGALNCSIRDGWWDESYRSGIGWAIESAEDDPDLERRDQRECASLYSVLEEQVIPTFYDHTTGGLPRAWIEMIQGAWANLGPQVTAARMVRDYTTEMYEPAAADCRKLTSKSGAPARQLAEWRTHVQASWPSVRITSLDVDTSAADTGAERPVTVTIATDGLTPDDLRVDVVHGTVGPDGEFQPEPATLTLTPAADGSYRGELVLQAPGSYGVTARVIPVHPALASPYDLGLATWAQ
jgi:glycogen phosphorylase